MWGPTLIGAAFFTAATTALAELATTGHHVAVVPCVICSAASFFMTMGDLLFDGVADRRKNVGCADCESCRYILAAVTRDRDELREALVVLRLPEDRK